MTQMDSGFGPWVSIDCAALRHNLARVREAAPACGVWAVIKANAYGHGLEAVAASLHEADGFALARLDEALQLRAAGITKPLLILEGVHAADELLTASHAGLEIVVHHQDQLQLLQTISLEKPVGVWLKLDTGMHRLGFSLDTFDAALQQLKTCASVAEIGVMTHLANADDRLDLTTRKQCEVFENLTQTLGLPRSCANSAGILGFPDSHYDRVRPGIMLYGISPFNNSIGLDEGLKPVMTFGGSLIAVKQLQAGDRVGYGGTYECPQAMTVGVIGVGYGDGYPRHAAPGTAVLVNGERAEIIGRVSMDMITVDLSYQPAARVGDPVILWGEGLPVEEVAQQAGTIAYELLCGITARVKRMMINDQGEDLA